MTWDRRALAASVLVLVTATLAGLVFQRLRLHGPPAGAGPHGSSASCETCHLHAGEAPLRESGDEACLRCHPPRTAAGAPRMDHPTGVTLAAGIALPEGLPLGAGGVVRCFTCHDPHADPERFRLLLRRTGNALCLPCHPGH